MCKYQVTIMKRQLFTFSFLCLLALGTRAQDTLTLEDCLKIGIENNLSLQSKRKEIQKEKNALNEQRKMEEELAKSRAMTEWKRRNPNYEHDWQERRRQEKKEFIERMKRRNTSLIRKNTFVQYIANYKAVIEDWTGTGLKLDNTLAGLKWIEEADQDKIEIMEKILYLESKCLDEQAWGRLTEAETAEILGREPYLKLPRKLTPQEEENEERVWKHKQTIQKEIEKISGKTHSFNT